uniref:cytochrome-c oxidase n=1 Tax=Diplonema papillatum TaxID=91374 RepID=E5L3L4_9EUGL|nr:cytochrome c oxidase subunit 2 [Diplonema papillatum]APQ44783.1 cytochrome c oxidase subunit 2 [Diplonema papillatum]
MVLLHGLAVLYTTHVALEVLNVAIVVFIAGAAMHSATVSSRNLYTSNLYLELVWLLTPTAMVTMLVVRVVVMQCSEEELQLHGTQVHVVANQWYWVYYVDAVSLFLYAVQEHDMHHGDLRLLCGMQSLLIDSSCSVLLALTSSDVIHAWALPSLGMKVDCVPGRANTATLVSSVTGTLYGQCSEVCGALHGYMPLCMVTV